MCAVALHDIWEVIMYSFIMYCFVIVPSMKGWFAILKSWMLAILLDLYLKILFMSCYLALVVCPKDPSLTQAHKIYRKDPSLTRTHKIHRSSALIKFPLKTREFLRCLLGKFDRIFCSIHTVWSIHRSGLLTDSFWCVFLGFSRKKSRHTYT